VEQRGKPLNARIVADQQHPVGIQMRIDQRNQLPGAGRIHRHVKTLIHIANVFEHRFQRFTRAPRG